ncbi:MAG: hypothetical protein KDA89_24035, partial [Planctomycetaceae bacterium]|nr:hypothetical protein [Planctomycetaceae bacterium]
ADRLVGFTLFRRLYCCYGPWCESDGRKREIWPDASRVPVCLAVSVLSDELHGLQTGQSPIPATASRDEVFAHRCRPGVTIAATGGLQHMNGAVISPDGTFRRIVTRALKQLGLRSLHLPLIPGRQKVLPRESNNGPIHLVFHDLDPWCHMVEVSLHACRTMFPSASVFGLASMTDGGLQTETADEELCGIIPKLDLHHGLKFSINTLLCSDMLPAPVATSASTAENPMSPEQRRVPA